LKKPGLSAYAGDTSMAAESLTSLLENIEDSVPLDKVHSTPCQLRATAGLRLLPGGQSAEILEAVSAKLQSTAYSVAANAVDIMDGSQEGAFAWLTVNYLLNKCVLYCLASARWVLV